MNATSLRDARDLATQARTPFPGESEAYRTARQSLLAAEIELRRHMTRVTEQRQALPPASCKRSATTTRTISA
jgi:predicted dithiol-disulfide oxidoreductase (DUF899 family)